MLSVRFSDTQSMTATYNYFTPWSLQQFQISVIPESFRKDSLRASRAGMTKNKHSNNVLTSIVPRRAFLIHKRAIQRIALLYESCPLPIPANSAVMKRRAPPMTQPSSRLLQNGFGDQRAVHGKYVEIRLSCVLDSIIWECVVKHIVAHHHAVPKIGCCDIDLIIRDHRHRCVTAVHQNSLRHR